MARKPVHESAFDMRPALKIEQHDAVSWKLLATHWNGTAMSTNPKSRTPDASSSKKPNAGFMLTPEQHEAIGHSFKATNPERAMVHYRLARVIRDKIAIAAGRTH